MWGPNLRSATTGVTLSKEGPTDPESPTAWGQLRTGTLPPQTTPKGSARSAGCGTGIWEIKRFTMELQP